MTLVKNPRSRPVTLLTAPQPLRSAERGVNRREFLTGLGLAAPLLPAAPQRPNIILILADDLGYGDLGCYGQQRIRTPRLDRMAAEGTRLTQAYAGSTVCAPSRCCLMTGLHTGHGRVRGNASPQTPLRAQDTTVAQLLKRAGYRTAVFGKWGLGDEHTASTPNDKGFDEWFGYLDQVHAHDYYPEFLWQDGRKFVLEGNRDGKQGDYSHDLFTNHALRFVKQTSATPFFLYLAYTIPHANPAWGVKTGNGMQVPEDAPYSAEAWPPVEKNFAAMVTRMDRDVGRLLDQLRESGQDRNTFVLFMSDNGPHRAGQHDPQFFDGNGPLRGIKGDLLEGGIRVPAMVRWPGRVPAGRVSHYPWAAWDFLPTALELAGCPIPAGLDGISVLPELLGKHQRPHEYLYWEFGGTQQAVRLGDWKALRTLPNGDWQIYNLARDPGETTDLAASQPALLQRVRKLVATCRTDSPEFPLKFLPGKTNTTK